MFIYVLLKLIRNTGTIDTLSPNFAFPILDFDFISDQGLRTLDSGLKVVNLTYGDFGLDVWTWMGHRLFHYK